MTAPGYAKGGTGVLKVDGKDVDTKKFRSTIPFIYLISETFDVGVRYTDRGERCRLPRPVPFHGHDQQAHAEARTGAIHSGRSPEGRGGEGQGE